jgi:type II secretory pathway pseudopilin PulG
MIVIAIVVALASLLLPALNRGRDNARRVACISNLRQMGMAFSIYRDDNDERFPDRRDLKNILGYRPWTDWPSSDPRSGWAAIVLHDVLQDPNVWKCPGLSGTDLAEAAPSTQDISTGAMPSGTSALGSSSSAPPPKATYWMWRFDQAGAQIPLDNFWGKTETEAIADLREASNIFIGIPTGPMDVEVSVDVYYPLTAAGVPAKYRGRSVHRAGRNRLMLDNHVERVRK